MPTERPWSKVPVGPHAPRWRTVSPSRTVLAVVHNVTAATRLFDVLPLVAVDPRVQVVFTGTESSPFTAGLDEFLAAAGVAVIPWEQAVRTRFDLAVSASYRGELADLQAPLLTVPHGMGYNKYLRRNPKSEIRNPKSVGGARIPAFGFDPESLYSDGVLIPSSIVLSHPEQRARLARFAPEAASIAVIAGDPCFDRMLASPSLRAAYRDALGAADGQRLVLVSSTWGAGSLFEHGPELVARLAGSLPLDEFRVVLALHPNIWHGHSRWQVRMWLARCARNGVVVLPPEEGWRAALVAADVVIGDHGSVTFYGAALGRPILLASAPTDTVAPDSPIARLVAAAPELGSVRDLPARIDRLIAEHDPNRYAEITRLTTAAPGESAALLRREMYRLMTLPEPAQPALTATLPLPEPERTALGPRFVAVEFDQTDAHELHAMVRRYPADETAAAPDNAHLVVDASAETPQQWVPLADVLVCAPRGEFEPTMRALLADSAALLVTAQHANGHWSVLDPNGLHLRFSAAPREWPNPEPNRESSGEPRGEPGGESRHDSGRASGSALGSAPADGPGDASMGASMGTEGRVCASVVFAWLAQDRKATSLPERLVITVGARRLILRVEFG